MSDRSKKFPPAFKHGGYARTILFPGEDQAAYKRLYDGIVAEFAPVGPVEEDIVKELADNVWRKQNLRIFRVAKLARYQYDAFFDHCRPKPLPMLMPAWGVEEDTRSPEQIRALEEAAKQRAREELSEVSLQLVEMGEEITIEHYMAELTVLDRINANIDRCIKRLLMVRGAKSMSLSPSPTRKPSHR